MEERSGRLETEIQATNDQPRFLEFGFQDPAGSLMWKGILGTFHGGFWAGRYE